MNLNLNYTMEQVRDLAAKNPHGVDIESERRLREDAVQIAARCTEIRAAAKTAGRDLLASEDRETSRLAEQGFTARNLADLREQRYEEAARIRVASGVDLAYRNPPVGVGAANAFGESIRAAVDEVRGGRAEAFVDYPTPHVRTLTEAGSAGQGVPVQIMSPVSTLMAKSVVMSLPGILHDTMTSDRATWPRIGTATADGTAEGATLVDADTQTDSVTVIARKFSTYETLSTELEEDYSANALATFGNNLLARLALRVDLGLLEGDGALDLVGLRNAVGANSTTVAATPSNFAKFRTVEYELRLDNGEPVVWVMHPRTWNTLAGIKTGLSSDETTLLEPDPQQGPKTLLGFPVAFSTQITLTEGTNGSWAALLDTSQLVVCERRPARLEFSRDFKFDEDKIAVRATWRGALAVLNSEAVSLATDIRA